MVTHISTKSRIMDFFSSILHFKHFDTHVKISKIGQTAMNNKEMSSKIVDTIMQHKKELEEGKTVKVDDEKFSIGTVTSLPDIPVK